MKSEAFRVLILLICVSETLAWIRFRQPPSRRNFVVQTPIDTLQKCDTRKNTFCKLCGEGNASTNGIPVSNYTIIDRNTRILAIEVAFQVGLDGYLEFRLCGVTDNATMDAIVCRDVSPLLIGASERWYPNPDQSYAQSRLRLPADLECVRCVLQVKYTPGDQSMMKNLRFYDCSLLNISRPSMETANIVTTQNLTTNTNINLIPGEVINDGSVSHQTTNTKTVKMEVITTSSRDTTQPKRAFPSDHAILEEEQMFSNNDVANGNRILVPKHERRQFGHFGFNTGISTFPSRGTDHISNVNLRHSLTGTAVISGKGEPTVGRVSGEGIQRVDTITGTLHDATNITPKGALNVDNTIAITKEQEAGFTGDANIGRKVVTNVDEMNILRINVISNRDSAISEDINNSRGTDSVNVVNTVDSSQNSAVSGVQTDGTRSSFIEQEMTGVFDSGVNGALGTPVKDGLTTFREQSGRVLTFDRQRNDQPSSLSSSVGGNISTNVVRTTNNNAVRLGTVGVINNDLTITKVNNGANSDTSVVKSDPNSQSGATSLLPDNSNSQATRNKQSDFQTNNISTIQAVDETINNGAIAINRTFIDNTLNGQKDTIGAGVRSVDDNRMTNKLDVVNNFEQNGINIGISDNTQSRGTSLNISSVGSNMITNIGIRNSTAFNETMMYYDNVYYDYNGTSGTNYDDVFYNDTNTDVYNKSITQESLVNTNSTVTTAINIETPATTIQASINDVSQQNGVSATNSVEENVRIMGVSGFVVDGVNEYANQNRIGIIENTNTGYTDKANVVGNRRNLVNTIGGSAVRDVNISIDPPLNDFGNSVNQYQGSMVQGPSVSNNNIAQMESSRGKNVISANNRPITEIHTLVRPTLVPIHKVTSIDQINNDITMNNAQISTNTARISSIIAQHQPSESDRRQTMTQHSNIVAEVHMGSSSNDLNVDNNLNIDQNLDGAFPVDSDVNKYLGETEIISTPIVNQRTDRTVGILSENQVRSEFRPINDVSIKNIMNSDTFYHRSSVQSGTVKNSVENAYNSKVNNLVATVTENVLEVPVSTVNTINLVNDVNNRVSATRPDSNANINSMFDGHSFFTEGTSDVDRLGGVPIAVSERGVSTLQNTGDNRLTSGGTAKNQDSKQTWSASKFDKGNSLDTSNSLGVVVVDVNMGQSRRHGTLARNTGQPLTDTVSVNNSEQILKSTDEFARSVDNSIKRTQMKTTEESIASQIGNTVVWQVMDVDANNQTQNDVAVNRHTVLDGTTKRIAKDHLEMMVNGDAVLNNILPKRTISTNAIQSLHSVPDVMPPIDFKVEDSRTIHSIQNNINGIALPSTPRANKDGGSYIINNLLYRSNDTNMKLNGQAEISSGGSKMSGSTLWDINRQENKRTDIGSDRTTTTVLRKTSNSHNTLPSSVDRSTWNSQQINDEQLPNYKTSVYDQPRVIVSDQWQSVANSTTHLQVHRTLEALALELKAIKDKDVISNGNTAIDRTNIVNRPGVTTQGASTTTNGREVSRTSGPIVSSNTVVDHVTSKVTNDQIKQSSFPLFRVHETMLTLPRNLQEAVDLNNMGLSQLRRGTNHRGANNHMLIENTFAIPNRRLNAVYDQQALGVNDNNILFAANEPNLRVRNVENERTSNSMTLNRDNNAGINNLNAVREPTGVTSSRLVETKYNMERENDASYRNIQNTDIARLGFGVNGLFIPRTSEGVFQSVINITRPRRNTTDLFSALSNAFASVSAQDRKAGRERTAVIQESPTPAASVSLNTRGENDFFQSVGNRQNVQQNVIGIDAPVLKQVVIRSSPLTTNPWSGAILDLTKHNDTFLPRGSTRFQNRIRLHQGSDKGPVSVTPELRQFQISNQTQTANNVAIESKHFIGQMQRNELRPIEPVYSEGNTDASRTVTATRKVIILNATNEKPSTANVPRSVDRNINIGKSNEIILSSNNRISPLMDVNQAMNTNQIVNSALTNFNGNNIIRASGENSVPNIGIESPSTNRVFFNQADLLNTFGISVKNDNGKLDTVATSESSTFVPGISNKTDSDIIPVSCPGSTLYVCEAVGENKQVPGMVWWCYSHCKNGDCPFDKCACRCVNANAVMKQEVTLVNETPATKNTTIKNKRLKTVVALTLNGSKKTTIPVEKSEMRSTNTKVIMPLRERDQTGSNLFMNTGNNVALDSQHVSNVQVTSNNIANTNNPKTNGIATTDVFSNQVKEVLGSTGPDRTASESASIVVEKVINGVVMPRGSTIRSTNSGIQQVASESRINQGNDAVADSPRVLSCKGINAFVNTPGITDWCVAMCTDAVCPVDICSCS